MVTFQGKFLLFKLNYIRLCPFMQMNSGQLIDYLAVDLPQDKTFSNVIRKMLLYSNPTDAQKYPFFKRYAAGIWGAIRRISFLSMD